MSEHAEAIFQTCQELLEEFVGDENNDELRHAVTLELEDMIEVIDGSLQQVTAFRVVCDKTTNTSRTIRAGELRAAVHLVIGGKRFERLLVAK